MVQRVNLDNKAWLAGRKAWVASHFFLADFGHIWYSILVEIDKSKAYRPQWRHYFAQNHGSFHVDRNPHLMSHLGELEVKTTESYILWNDTKRMIHKA